MIVSSFYLVQVTLTWGILYGFYLLFLGKETFFRTNRLFLLGALVIGLVMPFLQSIMQQTALGVQVVELPMVTISSQELSLPNAVDGSKGLGLNGWLSVVYWVGFGVMSLRFIRDLIGIVWLARSGRREKIDGLTLVHIDRDMAPFSFFNYLFVFDKDSYSDDEWRQIFSHEKTHIHQLHSIDILFTEVIKIALWWNPLIYLYQSTLREVHEYEADFTITKQENIKQYGLLLMKQSLSGNQVALTNSFINSQLKKRIIMMTKKRSKTLAKTRYIWSLPLLLILFFISFGSQAIAQGTPIIAEESVDTVYTVNAETYEETVAITRTTIYKNQDLDRNAVLKSCEAAGDAEEQGLCSTNKLISTVYNGIKYPTEAKKAGIEGMVLVKINVLTSGKGEYSILKDPGYGMGPEVIRVLSSAELQWNTAELNKKPVVSQLIFPVKFKLQK